jgi:hypothetical protein
VEEHVDRSKLARNTDNRNPDDLAEVAKEHARKWYGREALVLRGVILS